MEILSIEFPSQGQMKLTVQMPEAGRFTTHGLPHLPRRLFHLFPQLTKHKCDNDFGYTFRRECQDTELPHLLEHLIIELQSQAEPSGILRGQTVWDWRLDPRGRFHVYIDYHNELLAIASVRLAERVMKAIDGRDVDQIDISTEVDRLRDVARLGRELASRLPLVADHSWSNQPEPARPQPLVEKVAVAA